MAPVEGIRRITAGPARPLVRRNPSQSAAGSTAEIGGSRALIAIAPPVRSDSTPRSSRRPSANFLAHLIATAEQVPQTRARRRADPDVAAASYRTVAADPVLPAGQHFARSC